jgi:Prokaryotic E2 family E
VNEAVARAVSQIRDAFPESHVEVHEDGQGGAWVMVDDIAVGDLYTHARSWVGFRITFQYPNADVYPHFVRSDLLRKDGRPLGDGISGGHTFLGRSALQISRRSNRLNPATDTAQLKLLKVLQWLSTHP